MTGGAAGAGPDGLAVPAGGGTAPLAARGPDGAPASQLAPTPGVPPVIIRDPSPATSPTAILTGAKPAGSATVNAGFYKKDVTVTGELTDYASVADSGTPMHRKFCPACGTAMFSEAETRPHLIFIRAGTLDDPGIAAPQATIWTKMAPQWACINETLPQFEGQPPPAG